MVGVVSNRTVMLLLAYFAELVISSLTIKPSGIANPVGISIFAPSTIIVYPASC